MRQRLLSASFGLSGLLPAEVVGAGATLALSDLNSWQLQLGLGAGVGVVSCVPTIRGAPPWQWARRVGAWARCRNHTVKLIEPVSIDGVGVVVDGDTICTAIAVLGRPYEPTTLYTEHTETLNTVPVSLIIEQMRRYGLAVDVDIICEGQRIARDNYADLYGTFLRGLPAAGQRSTTLLVRFDARSQVPGLLSRHDTTGAAITTSQRIVRALLQSGCRAELLGAEQMSSAVATYLGGAEHVQATHRDQWTRLRRAGKAYITSYYLSAEDLAEIDSAWTYPSDHTTLVVALRSGAEGVRASAMIRLTTVQPPAAPPGSMLNPMTGHQWDGVALTLPGRARLRLPSAPVTDELDAAVVAGSSGVLLGKLRDALVLMPIFDPAQNTRVTVRGDDKFVRQLIRRAAGASEKIAVYDCDGHWKMTAGSPGIWTTTDPDARPPRPPTMVIHNGSPNGVYPKARTLVTVGGAPTGATPHIAIEQSADRIIVKTARYSTTLTPVSFRAEEPYLR